ncbi:peroxisomal membrane protein 13 isoform X2 [Rosa chinensis]|uniref:peroxisomal membrane protein 13 isoform X2 n=1 Tax=Rosa chinensis TaxID=74649 RepID=UPI001AD9050A|nr:peroxisomal membrane protein 13 isoform X2 [Rosa chinensis]
MAGNGPPPKPWEQAGSSSGPAPFKPSSAGSTSDVVEASGTARPGEIVSSTDKTAIINRNTLGRPVPSRPWVQNYGSNTYGGYGSTMNYNSGYGSGMTGISGMYGGTYGGNGGLYGGGMYGNSMYTGGYGGLYGGSSGMYGAGSSGMYGGGMYNSGMGGPMGGYGMGMGGPYGGQDPNDPYGGPPSPPGFWVSVLRVLFDRSGILYGELARFVLRILGIRTKPKMGPAQGPNGLPSPGPGSASENRNYIEGPKAAPSGSWENVWGNDTSK